MNGRENDIDRDNEGMEGNGSGGVDDRMIVMVIKMI